jgi:Sap, sulfolipid-1-addressing protein
MWNGAMGLILPMLFLGLMASLSPTTIVVFLLVLQTTRARVNAVGFLAGWGLSLTLVFAGSYALAASDTGQRGGVHTTLAVSEILLGIALFVVAARLWRRRDTVPTRSTGWGVPRLMGHLESLSPMGAAVVGVLKQPWAITAAAALFVVHHHLAGLVAAIAFVFFTVASTATVGLMFLFYARHPDEAQTQLSALRDRVVAAGPALGAAAGMLVGGFLTIDGLLGLR